VTKFQDARRLGLACSGLRRQLLPARLLHSRAPGRDFVLAAGRRFSEPTEHSHARYLRNKELRVGFGRELDKQQRLLTVELIIKIVSVQFAGMANLGNLVRMFGLPLHPAAGLR
jgi:hypothetical protein